MTTTKALDGLRPSRIRGGSPNSSGMNEYRVSSGYAANIFTGDIVVNADGYVNVLTTTTQKALGVFMGCNYVANGEPKWSAYWPSGTSVTEAVAYVMDNPSATFVIQADASVSIGDINSQNFNVTLGSGSTVTGRSGFGINVSSRTTGSAMLRPIAVVNEPGNDIDVPAERAFPKLEVRIVKHVDAYISADSSVN
jgi:hypothetical protein